MVKEKPNSIRTYDEEGFRKRAACLCVRSESEDEVLLVSSSADRERWIVPGGGLEPNEDASTAALREVMEEAGVIGHLARCLGSFEHAERKHRTLVYVLNVTQEFNVWDECSRRRRKWFKIEDAIAELSLHRPIECKYVKALTMKNSTNNQVNKHETNADL